MSEIVWLKFAEDTGLPSVLTETERRALENIFDAGNNDSLWNWALEKVGLKSVAGPLLKWQEGQAYFNWSLMTALISSGWISASSKNGDVIYVTKGGFISLVALLKTQWKISRYYKRILSEPVPDGDHDKIIQSIALGFALLSLTLQLPKHDERLLAQWLSDIDKLKPSLRRVLEEMQKIQARRTLLSSGWHAYFPQCIEGELEMTQASSLDLEWKGIGVSGSRISARVVIAGKGNMLTSEPLIYIFPRARPETIEYFERAAGIIYAQGGVMSHACTIAREMNVNCITAAGEDFIANLQHALSLGEVWLDMNGATGEIKLIKSS